MKKNKNQLSGHFTLQETTTSLEYPRNMLGFSWINNKYMLI